MNRIAITYVLRGELYAEIEAFRMEHDWLARSIPAHLSLIPPFHPAEPNVTRVATAALIDQATPVQITTGLPRQEPERVFLPIEDGHDTLAALRSAFLAVCGHRFDHLPALGVTVARPRAGEERGVLSQAKTALQPLRLMLDNLALLEESEDGSWAPQ